MANQASRVESEFEKSPDGSGIKQIARASMLTAASSLLAMIIGLVKWKVIASTLGPEGIGLLAQLSNLEALMAGLAGFGMSLGLSKLISQHLATGNYLRIARTWMSARLMSLILSAGILAALVALLKPLSTILVDNPSAGGYLLIVGAAVPLSALSSLYSGLLGGTRAIKPIAVISIVSALGSLCIAIPLVLVFGLVGVVIQITLSAGIGLVLRIYYGRRTTSNWPMPLSPLRIYKHESLVLIAYGSFSLLTTIAHLLTLLYIQTIVIHQGGLAANGLFQSTWGIWWPFASLAMSAVSLYVLPGISASSDEHHVQKQVNSSLRLLIMVTTPVTFIMVLFSNSILSLAYSPEFSQAGLLLQLMAVSTAFRMLAFPLAMRFVAKGRLKFPLVGEFIWYASLAISMTLLLPKWGLTASGVAVLVSQVVYFLYVLIGARQLFGLSYSMENLGASITAVTFPIGLLLAALFLPLQLSALVTVALLTVWATFVPNKPERQWISRHLRLSP